MRHVAPRRRPSLEVLEDRCLMTISGLPWADPQHLTLSFIPDGTLVGGVPSTLFKTLNAEMPTATWETDILRAFQSWADLGNINISLVSDDGQSPGQPGPLEGNPGHGDIRIGAQPLSSDKLAMSTPFDALGGEWSGVVTLNSLATFGDSPQATENLFTAALHEAGVVLGLAETPTDSSSAMYTVDTGPRTGPSASDVDALQALYGPRQIGTTGHNTLATAAPLGFVTPVSVLTGTTPAVSGDISSLSDTDVYSVSAATSGAFAVDLRASGISLLTAAVTVVNASGQTVASAEATNPLHNDLTLAVPNAKAGAVYHVEVQSARADVFGIGSYRISAGQPILAAQAVAAPAPADGVSITGLSNLTFNQATSLTPQTPGTDARWPYLVHSSLLIPGTTNYFAIQAGAAHTGALIVSVWGSAPGGLSPQVVVLDSHNKPVATQVVAQDSASETIEVLAPTPGARYVVAVSAAPSVPALSSMGSYTLAATFHSAPLELDPFASGTLDASQSENVLPFDVNTSNLFHFDLSGGPANSTTTAVSMTILDASNQPVFHLSALGGAGQAGGDVLLDPGTYTVQILAATRNGAPLSSFNYSILTEARTAPIGPDPTDPTLNPVNSPPDDPTLDDPSPDIIIVDPDSSDDDFLIMSDPFGDLGWD